MSVEYSANIYYGVELTDDEAKVIPEDLWEKWAHYVDAYVGTPIIFGYLWRQIPEGEAHEFTPPRVSDTQHNALRKALHEAMIDRKPKLYLACCVQ